jgi:CubicO group peptidase (beta-lactamase class C family)
VSSPPPDPILRILREGQATHRLPSVSAAVYRGDEIVWSDAFGRANEDGASPDAETQYRIGSITKTFTAAAILLLRDQGRLELDDPLVRHVPDAAVGGDLSLRRLLAHTSGLQREPPGEVWETLDFPDAEALLARLDAAELVLQPGARFHYSNLAYALLGQVVACVAGAPFTQFVDERLIGPLGLERTTWERVEPAARGYYVDPFARVLCAEPDLTGGGAAAVGSLWSTPGDLCRWADYLASLEELHQVQVLDDPDAWTVGHGLGLQLVRSGERVFFGHGGAMPGFLAMLLGRRRERVGAAVVTNATTPAAAVETICLRLAEEALELWPRPSEPWQPEEAPPPEIAELLGFWWSEGAPFAFWWEGGRLRARPLENEKPRALSIFEPEGPDRFRVAEGRERGELLRVIRDPHGAVLKLYWATYPLTRAPRPFA